MELWGWGGRKDGLCRKEVWGRSEVGAPRAGPPEGVGQSGELPVPALVEVALLHGPEKWTDPPSPEPGSLHTVVIRHPH